MAHDWKADAVTRRQFLAFLSAAAGGTAMIGRIAPASAATPTGTPKFRLKLAHHLQLSHIVETMSQKFASAVATRTNGQVEIKVFGAGQIGGLKDNAEGVRLGTLDFCCADCGQVGLFHARANIVSLPFLFRDYPHYRKVIEGPVGKQLAKEILENANMRLLSYWPAGFRIVASRNKPIKTAADMKGLKIRIPEVPIYVETMRALGANATPMPWGEVYTALQTGVVDAIEVPSDTILNGKMYEVAKYLSRTYHIFTDCNLFVSEKVYASLPADIQQTIFAAAREIFWDWGAVESEKLDKDGWDSLIKAGMQGIEPDRESFRVAVKPVWDNFITKTSTGDWIKAVTSA
jgi:tripartite ATP-independent transporter DctP family solute receptor